MKAFALAASHVLKIEHRNRRTYKEGHITNDTQRDRQNLSSWNGAIDGCYSSDTSAT
jgi:hypothetical protein